MPAEKSDLNLYLDAVAGSLGLAIPQDDRQGTLDNLATLFAEAAFVMAFPLPADADSAETFQS